MSYSSKNIKVLKGLDAVRKRPGMYIGNTEDGTGLHRMFFEILDNSMDEYYAGYCTEINITIIDSSVTIQDNGRGIPIDIFENTNKTTAEIILTTLHSGAKFDNNTYKISSGLHGVGLSVVNALSKELILCVQQKDKVYTQTYSYGNFTKMEINTTNIETYGTSITFIPDASIIQPKNFDYLTIKQRLQELTFLNKNITLTLVTKDTGIEKFIYSDGILGYLEYLIKKKQRIGKPFLVETLEQDVDIKICIQWTTADSETLIGFTNNTKQRDGGTHITGVRTAVTKIILEGVKTNKENITSNDIRVGLTGIISIKTANPKFASQTKDKLISTNIKYIVEKVCYDALFLFFLKHKEIYKNIIENILNTARARVAAKKIKETFKKENTIQHTALPNKLAECQETNPSKTELFIVEGDSAGGSAKQARDRVYQAILPLKGKIINAEKVGIEKLLENIEIQSILTTLGCGISINGLYHIKKLRYKTIIIMTDADTDGAHIRTLLLTFFYRKLPEIIRGGNLYIAQPPLYKVKKKGENIYLENDKSLQQYIKCNAIAAIEIATHCLKKNISNKILCHLFYMCTSLTNLLCKIFQENFKIFLDYLENTEISTILGVIKKNKQNLTLNDIIYTLAPSINKQTILLKLNIRKNTTHIYVQDKKYELDSYIFLNDIILKNFSIRHLVSKYTKNCNIVLLRKGLYELQAENIMRSFLELYLDTKNNLPVQRYKGLGEMNPEQLWDTTMCPLKRRLKKVKIINNEYTKNIFDTLMGSDVVKRRNFLVSNTTINKDIY